MPRISNKKEIIDHMEKSYDRQFKVSYLLMAAHGTGLVTAISILKDYVKEPQLNGVGLFLIICGVGFITALIHYVAVFMARAAVINAVMSDEDPNDDPTKAFLVITSLIAIVASIGLLIYAIGFLAWRFHIL
jgi:hypothetical protein